MLKKSDLEQLSVYVDMLRSKSVEVIVTLNADTMEKNEWLQIGESNCRAEIKMDFDNLESCKKKLENLAQLRATALDSGLIQPPKQKKTEE